MVLLKGPAEEDREEEGRGAGASLLTDPPPDPSAFFPIPSGGLPRCAEKEKGSRFSLPAFVVANPPPRAPLPARALRFVPDAVAPDDAGGADVSEKTVKRPLAILV